MEMNCQLHAPSALPLGKKSLVPIEQESGWAPEPVWTRWWREKVPAPAGIRTPQPFSPKTKAVQLSYPSSSSGCYVE
jgi:hypothetical protein